MERFKKRLVICYCETGHVKSALELFDKITRNNIELIAETNVVQEDCPCPEILERMRWYEQVAANSFDFHSIMGMLNLYCNIDDSLAAFGRALDLNPENELIKKLINRIIAYQNVHSENLKIK